RGVSRDVRPILSLLATRRMNEHINMNTQDHEDDPRQGELIRLADQGADPPDRQFLDRLRAQSAGVFAASSKGAASHRFNPTPRSRRIMTLFARAGAAALAASLLIAA